MKLLVGRGSTEDQRPVTVDEIGAACQRIGAGLDYVVLTSDDGAFVQFNGSLLEYGESGRLYRARVHGAGNRDVVQEVLIGFFERDPTWKGHVKWIDASRDLKFLGIMDPLRRKLWLWVIAAVGICAFLLYRLLR